jgi:hypothetical protein
LSISLFRSGGKVIVKLRPSKTNEWNLSLGDVVQQRLNPRGLVFSDKLNDEHWFACVAMNDLRILNLLASFSIGSKAVLTDPASRRQPRPPLMEVNERLAEPQVMCLLKPLELRTGTKTKMTQRLIRRGNRIDIFQRHVKQSRYANTRDPGRIWPSLPDFPKRDWRRDFQTLDKQSTMFRPTVANQPGCQPTRRAMRAFPQSLKVWNADVSHCHC